MPRRDQEKSSVRPATRLAVLSRAFPVSNVARLALASIAGTVLSPDSNHRRRTGLKIACRRRQRQHTVGWLLPDRWLTW